MKYLITLLIICLVPKNVFSLEILKIHADIQKSSFANDNGEGEARDFRMEIGERSLNHLNYQAPSPQTIYFQRVGEDFEVQTGFANVLVKNIPAKLTAHLNLLANDLIVHLGYIPTQDITVRSLTFTKPELGTGVISQLKLNCTPLPGKNADFNLLVDQCLNEGSLRLVELNIPIFKKFWSGFLDEQIDETEDFAKVASDLDMNINKGNFTIALKTGVFFRARVKAKGTLAFDHQAAKATIRIDEVRYAKLNITRIVFLALKASLPSSTFKIQQPYIYMQL